MPPREEGEPIMRRLVIVFSAVAVFAARAAFAVSDGQYLPANQNCTGNADNSNSGNRTEAGCHNMIVFLADGTGHQYAGWGLDQTPDGTVVHTGEVWLDPGAGSRYTWNFDLTAGSVDQMPTVTVSTPGDLTTGLQVYFGADDNLDSGEHDSAKQVSNGPSDGGAMEVNIAPAAASAWVATLQAADTAGLLAAPAPFANGGLGACADGFCIAVTTQRRVAFQGGRTDISRDVARDVGPAALEGDAALRGDRDAEAVCASAEAAVRERRRRREQPRRIRCLQRGDPCARGRRCDVDLHPAAVARAVGHLVGRV